MAAKPDLKQQRVYIVYRKVDFLLYLFGLVAFGALASVALHGPVEIGLTYAALAYLLLWFVKQHGAGWDASCFSAFALGVLELPVYLARLTWLHAKNLRLPVLLFVVALAGEAAVKRWLPDSRWNDLVPYYWIFAIHFIALTTFRTIVLVAHLRGASTVRGVLESAPSTWRPLIKRFSVAGLCTHAYVTGVITHLAAWIPVLILWRLTNPTWTREAILFSVAVVYRLTHAKLRGRSVPDVLHQLLFADERSLGRIVVTFQVAHEISHRSRFNFTIFHGHHHDAIPSSLIGSAGGTGIGESMERNVYFGWLTWSCLAVGLVHSYAVVFDMLGHQFIPGVFPYSSSIVRRRRHHVVHHYGKLQPVGLTGNEPGYNPANPIAAWFATTVKEREALPAEQCDLFTQAEGSTLATGR
jgi:hypothetical protein